MIDRQRIDGQRLLKLTTAVTLGLALSQANAQTAPAPAPAPAPPATTASPAAAPATGTEAVGEQTDTTQAADTAERDQRYAELRRRAAEVGLDLPETPPWAQAGMPGMAMPEGMMTRPEAMTPEELQAMREQRWEAMRARAAEQGVELPETPPWKAAEQRRQEMMERYEQYRATIEAMTDEQKEAVMALFGGARGPMGSAAMPYGGPCRGYGGNWGGNNWGRGYGMGRGMAPGMMPQYPQMQEPPTATPAPTPEQAPPAQPAG